MPTVPRYDSFQVGVASQPGAQVSAPQMPDVAGRQAQQLGQSIQQLGGETARIAQDMQQQANQLRVDDALNRAKEETLRLTYDKDAGYTNLKGFNALERPDGKPLADEYGGLLQQRISDIAGTLGNDVQRQVFTAQANGMLMSFKGNIVQYEASEFKNYALSTAEGIISTAQRDIGMNYNKPEVVVAAQERIGAQVYRQQQLLGKSAEWGEMMTRKMTSDGHKIALLTALEQNDPMYADGYLKRFSGQMNSDDILTVRGHITKAVDNSFGLTVAGDVLVKMQPRIQVGETERAFNVALGTESNHRQFDDFGKPLTSPKGAVGIAQVMLDTGPEAAKLAGLEWDENRWKNDEAYNRALGLAYFQKQLQTNGGDLAKAYGAYNAGPGRLQKAIAAADRVSKDPSSANITWLDYMPSETQKYVAKNMAEFNNGNGKPARPTLQDINDQIRSDPRLSNNPNRLKIALTEGARLFDEQTKAIKQRDEEAVSTAMDMMLKNGGRFTDLPASVQAAVPAKEVDSLLAYGQKISKGDDTTSLWLYNKLTNEPSYLAGLSDDQFYALRRELSESDFKHFSNDRAKLTGAAPGSNGPNDLNTSAIKQNLDDRLRMIGINPSPPAKDDKENARVGAIRQFVNQSLITAQRDSGTKFSDAEVSAHVDNLFAKSVTLKGWFSDSSQGLLTIKIGDIDSKDKASIKDAFKARGINNPTDAQIMNVYYNTKAR